VIVLLQSRTALLTMLISLMCVAALLRPHRRLAFALGCGLTLVALALLIDGCLGFPLLAKVVREWQGSGRGDLWRAAWAMFLEVLAERGLVGFLALGGLLACGLAAAWRIQRAAAGEARRLGAGALAGLIGLSSAAGVELTFLRQWVLVVLFLLLGVIAHLTSTPPRLREGDT
jgi:O-antigen ligase